MLVHRAHSCWRAYQANRSPASSISDYRRVGIFLGDAGFVNIVPQHFDISTKYLLSTPTLAATALFAIADISLMFDFHSPTT